MKSGKPQHPVTLWYCPGLKWDCFTFTSQKLMAIKLSPSPVLSVVLAQFQYFAYSPQTRRWSLIEMRQMRMRKISWLMTRCYYPSRKHSRRHLLCTRYRNAWCILCAVVEQPVAPTNSRPLVPTTASSPPQRTRPSPPTIPFPCPYVICTHMDIRQ